MFQQTTFVNILTSLTSHQVLITLPMQAVDNLY